MKIIYQSVALTIFFALTACGTLDSPMDAYQSGWRHAEVVQLVASDEVLKHVDEDCRSATGIGHRFNRFALGSYHYGGSVTMKKHRVSGVLDSKVPAVTDQVLVQTLDCGSALIPIEKGSPGVQ